MPTSYPIGRGSSPVLPDVLGDGLLDYVEVGCVGQVHPPVERDQGRVRKTGCELLPTAEADQPVPAVVQHQGGRVDGRQQVADLLEVDVLEVGGGHLR